MTSPLVTFEEAGDEVAGYALALTSSRHDAIDRKAMFATYLSELEARCPDLQHVNDELERLTQEAAAFGSDVDPEAAVQVVRSLAALLEPVQRLNTFADLIAEAASTLTEGLDP